MSEAKKFFRPGSKRTKEFLLAKTMMVLVLVFLTLNTPRIILGVVEVTQLREVEQCYENGLDYHVSKQTYILDFIARFLVILNSSVNFLIYCLVGSEFRAKLCSTMRMRGGGVKESQGREMREKRKESFCMLAEEGPSCDGTLISKLTMEVSVNNLTR